LFFVIAAGMVMGLLLSACGSTSLSSPTALAFASYLYEATASPTGSNTISALHPQTGAQVWQALITGVPVGAVVSGGTFVVSSSIPARDPSQSVSRLTGLDIQTGEQRWQRDIKNTVLMELFQWQGKIYSLLTSRGPAQLDSPSATLSLANVNLEDGSLIWQKPLPLAGVPRTDIQAGDMLYVVSVDSAMQYITMIHLTDGSLGKRIAIPVNLSADSGPTPRYANGTVYYDVQDSLTTFHIIAVHATNATPLWEKTFDRSAIVLTANNNVVLVSAAPDPNSTQGDPLGSLIALNPADGAPLWQVQQYSLGFGDVATEAERIFVMTNSDNSLNPSPSVRAFNARTGAVLWSDTLASSQQPTSIHVLAGIVYVEFPLAGGTTSQSDRLLAIRESDGALLWKSNRALLLLAEGFFW